MKRTILILMILGIIICPVFSQKLDFQSIQRSGGSTFFAINKTTGQLSFMSDYGDGRGIWKTYGSTIRQNGDANLSIYVEERTDGTAFFVLDGAKGQLYYMLDYGSNRGTWKSYGNIVPKTSDGILILSGELRNDGSAFFAIDSKTGQLYYMTDYGSAAGTWNSYGNLVPN
jgi:hypothetical protein